MKLSRNLSLKEFIKSNTATRLGIPNEPTEEHLGNMQVWALNVFQPIRQYFDKPIGISSGYRSKALNTAINGSLRSQHCKGQAGDIDADIFGGLTNKEIFEFIKDNLDFDQLIYEYPNKEGEAAWVHCSYVSVSENRNQILVANKVKGKTTYSKWV